MRVESNLDDVALRKHKSGRLNIVNVDAHGANPEQSFILHFCLSPSCTLECEVYLLHLLYIAHSDGYGLAHRASYLQTDFTFGAVTRILALDENQTAYFIRAKDAD